MKPEDEKITSNSKFRLLNYNNYYSWIVILLIVCITNAMSFLAVYDLRNFFGPSQKIVEQIN